MRIAIINTDYEAFLEQLYASNPGLASATYEEQSRVRSQSLFGVADFYSRPFNDLGHEATDFYFNNLILQRSWIRENAPQYQEKLYQWGRRKKNIPWLLRRSEHQLCVDLLEVQIRDYQPDVIWNQAPDGISCEEIRRLKPYCRVLLAQQASPPLENDQDWQVYDLAISSFPTRLDWFREKGVPATLNRLGFDPRVLDEVQRFPKRDLPLTFVGSLSKFHQSRVDFLEAIAARFPLMFWGKGVEMLPPQSPLRKCYQGEAYGKEMFQILARSMITLNHHGSVPPFANNMRLFEATGMGTLLITDWKENLKEMFEPGKEVVAYRSDSECLEQIQYYLDHPDESFEIASAGQQRTLREHTYRQRIEEMIPVLEESLRLSPR